MKGNHRNGIRSTFRQGLLLLTSAVLVLVLAGCSTTRSLEPGERLYTGAELVVRGTEPGKKELRHIEKDSRSVLLQKPNQKVLGLPLPLYWYHAFYTEKEKGLWYWLQNKLGEPPVLFDHDETWQSADRIEQKLFNRGYFDAVVDTSVQYPDDHRARVTYNLQLAPAYRIDTFILELDRPVLDSLGREVVAGLPPLQGKAYSLNALQARRTSIHDGLRLHGYYFLESGDLKFTADTAYGERGIRLFLRLRDHLPEDHLRPYTVDRIFVYPDYGPERIERDTVYRSRHALVQQQPVVRSHLFDRTLLIRQGERYHPERHRNTLNRLSRLDLFRFANIQFRRDPGADSSLIMNVFLSPRELQRIEGAVGFSWRPGTYAGPELRLSYIHRNIFGAAERLQVDGGLNINFPLPNAPFDNSFDEMYLRAEIDLPGLRVPFERMAPSVRLLDAGSRLQANWRRERLALPLKREADLVEQLELAALGDALARDSSFAPSILFNRLELIYGYHWQRKPAVSHLFNPVDISFQLSGYQEPELRELLGYLFAQSLEQADYLQQLEDVWTIKPHYGRQLDTRLRDEDNPLDIFYRSRYGLVFSNALSGPNTPFRTSVQVEQELRAYWQWNPHSTLAQRIMIQGIVPLAEAATLPVIDLYRIGGPSTLRGFRPREIGPGTTDPESTTSSALGLLSGQGELMVLANLEMRQEVHRYVELAAFVDVGNVWLLSAGNADNSRFAWKDFLSELALDAGAGIRFNLSVVQLRLDLAFPLSKPWLPAGQRWVGNRIRPGDPVWRRDNLVLNLTFGYPF